MRKWGSGSLSGLGGEKALGKQEVRESGILCMKRVARAQYRSHGPGPGEPPWQASNLARGACERACVQGQA